jgi:hypothetical protein
MHGTNERDLSRSSRADPMQGVHETSDMGRSGRSFGNLDYPHE